MILSIARAEVDQQDHAHVLGAWSSMVTLDHPVGLVRCWLTHAPGRIEILAIWEDREAHDRALSEEQDHPAYRVFAPSGTDVMHEVFDVLGELSVPR